MPAHFANLVVTLRKQVPTVLTLALLAAVAWWGHIWQWKIPSLPQLLNPTAARNDQEEGKKDDKKEAAGEDRVLKAGGVEIDTATVKEEMIDEHVTANGDLDFDQDHYAHLSSRAAGTAFSVHKHAGDEVKKGDVLALVASPELAKLKFDLQQTLLNVHTRQRYYQIMEAAGSGTARREMVSGEAALREARIRLSNDQQTLQNLGLTVRVEELVKLKDEQVDERLRTLGIPDTVLQRLDPQTLTSNLLPLYAPFDGIVVQRDIVVGEVVNPNPTTPQFVLADVRKLWLMLHLRIEDAGKVKIGQGVAFRLDATGEEAPAAEIKWVSAEVDEKTRTVLARADVANADGRLRPHSFGTGRVLVGRHRGLTVPSEALQFDGQSHYVFVRGEAPGEFRAKRVEVVARRDKFTEIRGEVRAGQEVATTGSHALLSERQRDRISGED